MSEYGQDAAAVVSSPLIIVPLLCFCQHSFLQKFYNVPRENCSLQEVVGDTRRSWMS